MIYTLYVIALSIVAYNVRLNPSLDLYRHFEGMQQMRANDLSLFQVLFNNTQGILGEKYAPLIVFNVFRYIVAKMTDNYFWLPAITTFIVYAIISYIILDWTKSIESKRRLDLLTWLICFSFLPYAFTVSGIRNSLAASIMGLAIYFYLYKRKKVAVYIILSLISVTIHPATLMAVPFVFLSKFNFRTRGFILVIIISATAQYMAKLMVESDIMYLQIIGKAYYLYTAENQYRSSRGILYGVTLLLIILLLAYFIQRKTLSRKMIFQKQRELYNFIALYILYILGNIGNYDMVLRPVYVLGALSPVVVSLLTDRYLWRLNSINGKIKNLTSIGFRLFAFMLCMYMNYILLKGHYRWLIGR